MSQWTHVSGCLRVDGMPQMGLVADIRAILGTPSGEYDAKPYEEGSNIPGGSEGTIQYAINAAGDGLVWKTVAIWGDLRDFDLDDCAEIDTWFARIVAASDMPQQKQTRLMLRAFHLVVRVEYGQSYLLICEDGAEFDSPKTVRRVNISAPAGGVQGGTTNG